MERLGVARLIDSIEGREASLAVLPTGYGKSTIVVRNPRILDSVGRVIHVLPLRALVAQLAMDAAAALGERYSVCYQASLALEDVEKSPFLCCRYNIVTLDSFSLNFLGIPVGELFRDGWHCDAAMAMARAGAVILDEIHLSVSMDSGEAPASVASLVRSVARWQLQLENPLVVASATLPLQIARLVHSVAGDRSRAIVVAPPSHPYAEELRRAGLRVEAIWSGDPWVEAAERSSGIELQLSERSAAEIVIEEVKRGEFRSIGVFLNSARRATELCREVAEVARDHGYRVVLLHSKVDARYRDEATRALVRWVRGGERVLLVATQVVEAGIDVSLELGVSEPAPLNAIIQRVGRVCRYFECRGLFVVASSSRALELARGVYDPRVVEATMRFLKRLGGEGWRLRVPRSEDDKGLDYLVGIAEVYRGLSVGIDDASVGGLVAVDDPREVLRKLDTMFRGSIARSSSLVPGVYVERGVAKHFFTFSTEFLERACRDESSLCPLKREGKGIVAVYVSDSGEAIEQSFGLDLRALASKPMETMLLLSKAAPRGYRFAGVSVSGEALETVDLGELRAVVCRWWRR